LSLLTVDQYRGVALSMALVAISSVLWAAEPPGTIDQPIGVDQFPFSHQHTTLGKPEHIDRYSCNVNLLEGGGEVVYRLDVPAAGRIFLWLEGDSDTVDVDVHLLRGLGLDGGTATDCVDRAHAYVEVDIDAGTYWVVVDSYTAGGIDLPGDYLLHLDFAPWDQWVDRWLGRGVLWRFKLYESLFGGRQTASVLEIDPGEPGVDIRPANANGCETTASIGQRVGAVAGVNGGFFAMVSRRRRRRR
jgi:hypothetical protein